MAVKKYKKSNKTIDKKILIISIAVALVLSIIVSVFAISNNRKAPQHLHRFNQEVSWGIDVSEHNKEIEWDKIAKDFDFAFIRVGYRGYGNGKIEQDRRAKENMRGAQKAGIPFGVYFYSQAVTVKEAVDEAEFALDMVKRYDISLPIIIDFEYATDSEGKRTGRLAQSNLSAKENTEIISAFCQKVAEKGCAAGVYASSSVIYKEINIKSLPDDILIWVADYNDKVTYNVDYTVWQYSKTGTVDGIGSKYVDLNCWYNK